MTRLRAIGAGFLAGFIGGLLMTVTMLVFAWLLAVLIAAALNRLPRAPFAIGLVSAASLIALIVSRTSFPSDAARYIPAAVLKVSSAVRSQAHSSTSGSRYTGLKGWPTTKRWGRSISRHSREGRSPEVEVAEDLTGSPASYRYGPSLIPVGSHLRVRLFTA